MQPGRVGWSGAPRRASPPPLPGSTESPARLCPPQTFPSSSPDVNLGVGAQVEFNALSWRSFIQSSEREPGGAGRDPRAPGAPAAPTGRSPAQQGPGEAGGFPQSRLLPTAPASPPAHPPRPPCHRPGPLSGATRDSPSCPCTPPGPRAQRVAPPKPLGTMARALTPRCASVSPAGEADWRL